MGRFFLLNLVFPCACGVFACACGPSIDDLVEQLAGDADESQWARQELLLAKDRAVEPLLRALAEPAIAAARLALVEVLVSLMMRVEDDRITAALTDHLVNDPDVSVRSRIARLLGMHARAEALPAVLRSLDDAEGEVRHQALLTLSNLDGKLTPEQAQALDERAHELMGDAHPGVQLEAEIRIEAGVGKWIQEAEKAMLKAQVAEAESLLATALTRAPRSKRAQYRVARFHYDNGDREKGLKLLRQYGMLLDVPRLDAEPELDGELSDAVWSRAARVDSFFQLSMRHNAAPRSPRRTELYVAYTSEALLLGFYGHDDHPDSLVAKIKPGDDADVGNIQGTIWTDDIIELFIDADFDHKTYAHTGINTLGVTDENWIKGDRRQMRSREEWEDEGWSAGARLATHIGADYWSVEYRLPFDDERFPRPRPGTVWGFNMVRVFRGEEYSQWVRTYRGGHSPDDFGVLFFN